jgi:hypothetical protein
VVTKRAVQPEMLAHDVNHVAAANALIARIAADQRAGLDISNDVRALVRLAGPDQESRDRLTRAMQPGDTGPFKFECSGSSEMVKLRGGSLDGEYFCVRRPRADVWIHSQSLDATIRWKQRYRCVGHETVEDLEYGTLQVMSLQEFAAEVDSRG